MSQAPKHRQLPDKEAKLFKELLVSLFGEKLVSLFKLTYQMQYELKGYKKGLKAADTILKKFPNHGGTYMELRGRQGRQADEQKRSRSKHLPFIRLCRCPSLPRRYQSRQKLRKWRDSRSRRISLVISRGMCWVYSQRTGRTGMKLVGRLEWPESRIQSVQPALHAGQAN